MPRSTGNEKMVVVIVVVVVVVAVIVVVVIVVAQHGSRNAVGRLGRSPSMAVLSGTHA